MEAFSTKVLWYCRRVLKWKIFAYFKVTIMMKRTPKEKWLMERKVGWNLLCVIYINSLTICWSYFQGLAFINFWEKKCLKKTWSKKIGLIISFLDMLEKEMCLHPQPPNPTPRSNGFWKFRQTSSTYKYCWNFFLKTFALLSTIANELWINYELWMNFILIWKWCLWHHFLS